MQLLKTYPYNYQTKFYTIYMDNYFIFDRVMREMTDLGIGAVGTARGRRGWTPAEFKAIDDPRFNTV